MHPRTLAGRLFARRSSVTSAIAVGGHLLVLGFLATRPAPHIAPTRSPVVDDAPIAVDLDPERPAPLLQEPVPAPAPVAAAPSPASPAAHRRPLAAAPVAAVAAQSSAAPVGAGDVPLPSLSVPEAAPAPVAAGTVLPDALPPPLLPRATRAPPAALEAALATRQAATGTGAAAQVMAAVQRAAELNGPKQGHGIIRITVDADGTVSGVVATGVGWDVAARGILAALAGRRLRVPGGARGLVISFLADARLTRTPQVLTGEARAEPMQKGVAEGTAPPIYDNHRGMGIGAPNMAVIDALALLPVPRRVVKTELLREQTR